MHTYRTSPSLPPYLPPSQVSGRDGSHCSPPLSHTSDPLSEGSLMTDTSLPLHPNHHQLNVMLPSQNESGFCDDQSDVTGTSSQSHKQLHSPYNSTGVGSTYSSENSQYIKVHELPRVFQSPCFRSASIEDTAHGTEPADVLASLNRQQGKHHRKLPYSSLSQDTYSELSSGQYGSYYSPMTLSQRTDPQLRMHSLAPDTYPYHHHHHKPGSPASSSDTSSLTSSVAHRLGSHCASEISFTTTSSSRSNPNRLPRPPRPPSSSQTSSSGSNTSILHSKSNYYPAPSVHEYIPRTRSEIVGVPPYAPGLPHHYDYDTEEPSSMPALPSMKGKPASRLVPTKHPHGAPSIQSMSRREREQKLLMEREIMLREMKSRGGRRWGRRRPEQPRIPEEGSQRDSLNMKEDMVRSVLKLVTTSKDQSDADAANVLFELSQRAENCGIMRQMGCLGMLVNIIHHIEFKGDKSQFAVRRKAAAAMRKIVESTGETRQGKYEKCTLSVLEKFRSHCDQLWDFIYSYPSGRRVEPSEVKALQEACDGAMSSIRKLYKYSSDKDHFRSSVLTLGGIQATAEVLIVNYRLISAQKGSQLSEKPICHSSKAITVIISILINLTYGDGKNKSTLCQMTDCLKSLMFHLRQQNETIAAAGAQVLRNLSWRATPDTKAALLKCNAGEALMSAVKHVKGETTIQHITSALWNLSAHSVENRHKICSSSSGILTLIDLLSYNSPSGTTVVVENVGGIIKNLSVVIMETEGYRRKFRESGGLAKLVQHLKSKNKTVLANATGILWNLSARSPEDQKHLWDLGCIPLLDVLQSTPKKSVAGPENNIAECARGALRNLLAFGQTNGWTSKSDVTAYNLKTQRGLSKSLSSSANYAFALTQPTDMQQSNESLNTRYSQPLPKSKGSDSNVARQQNARMSSDRRHLEETDGLSYTYTTQREYEREAYLANKNKLPFSRVPSAPLTSHYGKEGQEFLSYMPNIIPGSGSSYTTSGQISYQDEGRRRKAGGSSGGRSSSSSRPRGRSIPFSFSQSESFHLSSNSELHSVEGASYGFSPNLSNEPSAASLSALDPKLDTFDPNHLGDQQNQEEYADLEVDEIDDIDNPIPRDNNPAEGYYSAMRRNSSSLTKGGTSNLALDGTTSDLDGAEISGLSQDSDDPRAGRSGGKVITEV